MGVDRSENSCNAGGLRRPSGRASTLELLGYRRAPLPTTVDSRTVPADIVSAALPEQEAAVNRLKDRLCAASAGLAATGLILTGCGSGQISQTASQESAVNGTSANAKNIALRNVQLLAVQNGDFLQPGRTVPLLFVAANGSPDVNDKLVGITSDIGTVVVTGDGAIPAGDALLVGPPMGQTEAMGSAIPPTAEVLLSKPITNGLTYNFTFTFDKAGQVVVAVPISAGETPSQ